MRQEEKRHAKKDKETQGYGDYNWEELYKSGKIKKLKVAELNNYIFRHNLSRRKMSTRIHSLADTLERDLDSSQIMLLLAHFVRRQN